MEIPVFLPSAQMSLILFSASRIGRFKKLAQAAGLRAKVDDANALSLRSLIFMIVQWHRQPTTLLQVAEP